MEPFSPVILFITPRKNGNPPPMNSQECFLQQVLGFDWFVTREDCAIPTIHFQQFTSCLSPLFFLGNPVPIIMNDIDLFVFVSPLDQRRTLSISAFIVSSSVTWLEQEYLLNWTKNFYNVGIEQSQLTWAQSFNPCLLSTASHHWRSAVQCDTWPLSVWAIPLGGHLGTQRSDLRWAGRLPLSATRPWLLHNLSASVAPDSSLAWPHGVAVFVAKHLIYLFTSRPAPLVRGSHTVRKIWGGTRVPRGQRILKDMCFIGVYVFFLGWQGVRGTWLGWGLLISVYSRDRVVEQSKGPLMRNLNTIFDILFKNH